MCHKICENIQGLLVVLGGILIHITLGGTLYSFGNMMTYMTSYMHMKVDSTVTYSYFIWVNAATVAFQGLFSFIGGIVNKKIGPRTTCLTGCFVMCCGVYLTCYSIQYSFLCVAITYGVLVGSGIAIAYVAPLGCGMKWFPKRKGLVTGFIVGGFGLGAVLTTPLETYFLNPENLSVGESGYFEDDAILDRVPGVFKKLTIIYAVMQVIGCMLIHSPPDETEANLFSVEQFESLLSTGTEEGDDDIPAFQPYPLDQIQSSASKVIPRDYTPCEVLKDRTFIIFFFVYTMNTFGIGFINTLYKSMGQTFITNDLFLSNVGAVSAIFNCGGRLFWGFIMDRGTFRNSMLCLTSMFSLLIATLPWTGDRLMGSVFALWIYLIFFTFSGNFVLMATVVEKAFGPRHYVTNYGLLFLSQAVSAPLMAISNHILLDNLGYKGCSFFASAMVFIGMLVTRYVPVTL